MHSALNARQLSWLMATLPNSNNYHRQGYRKDHRCLRYCSSFSTPTWSSTGSTRVEAQWHSWMTITHGSQDRRQMQTTKGFRLSLIEQWPGRNEAAQLSRVKRQRWCTSLGTRTE